MIRIISRLIGVGTRCRNGHDIAVVESPGIRMQHAYLGRIAPSIRFAEQITRREGEVLDLVVLGLTNAEVAQRLGIAARTVEVHRLRVMRKLEAASFCELMWLGLSGSKPPGSWAEAYFGEDQ